MRGRRRPTIAQREQLDDACAVRAAIHVDSLRSNVLVDGTLLRRPRDGYLDADVTISNEFGQNLEQVSFEYRDDYRPATLGDPDYENGTTDQRSRNLCSTTWPTR